MDRIKSTLESLTAEQKERLLTASEGIEIPIWIPNPGPQTTAYLSPADELFFGGSAGSSKSDLIIGLALTAHRNSLILRREATQVKAIASRLIELTRGEGWRGSGSGGTLRLANGGDVEVAGCEHEEDKRKYQGRPHDLKSFDELPNFTETQYTFISAWNRSVVKGQRCRVVGAGNPPTNADGEWVIRRWAAWLDPQHSKPAKSGELRWYGNHEGKEIDCDGPTPFYIGKTRILPRSRTFIFATVEDNPYLMETGYDAVLEALPEPLRSQMRYGNFRAGRKDDDWQVIPTSWVIEAQKRWKADGSTVPLTCMGVDVSRGGADSTVIAKRYGSWIAPLIRLQGTASPDGPTVAGKVMENLDNISALINIDVINVGSSPYDSLKAVQAAKLKVQAINFAESTDAKDRAGVMGFQNLRAEAYWRLRESLDPKKGDGLALPPDPQILADLTCARWTPTARGILLEKKDEIKKRIGRSPDAGDAIAMSMLPDRRPQFRMSVI